MGFGGGPGGGGVGRREKGVGKSMEERRGGKRKVTRGGKFFMQGDRERERERELVSYTKITDWLFGKVDCEFGKSLSRLSSYTNNLISTLLLKNSAEADMMRYLDFWSRNLIS